MSKSLGQVWVLLTFIILLVTGAYSWVFLFRDLKIQNTIFGSPSGEKTSYKISDFEFQIDALFFTKTGVENEYMSSSVTLPVTNYDKNKNYVLKLNNNLCVQDNTLKESLSADFYNEFYDAKHELIFTGKMNISIYFYKDYTRLIFFINGEHADSYWSQYIALNKLNIKIVESDYTPNIKADHIPIYHVFYHDENGEIIPDLTQSYTTFEHDVTLKTAPSFTYNSYTFTNTIWVNEDLQEVSKFEYQTSDVNLYLVGGTNIVFNGKYSPKIVEQLCSDFEKYYSDDNPMVYESLASSLSPTFNILYPVNGNEIFCVRHPRPIRTSTKYMYLLDFCIDREVASNSNFFIPTLWPKENSNGAPRYFGEFEFEHKFTNIKNGLVTNVVTFYWWDDKYEHQSYCKSITEYSQYLEKDYIYKG